MMFELDEEDLDEDYVNEIPPEVLAMVTHELQDTDYDSPHIEAEVRFGLFITGRI